MRLVVLDGVRGEAAAESASESGELAEAMRWRVGAGLLPWLDGKSGRRWMVRRVRRRVSTGPMPSRGAGRGDTSVGWSDVRRRESEGPA